MLQYDTVEQAQMRLQGSVITYKDKAALVRQVVAGAVPGQVLLHLDTFPIQTAGGSKSKKAERLTILGSDLDLNYRIFRLGYLNDEVNKTAWYVTRQGRRQQQQGLGPNTLGGMGDANALYRQEFEDMLLDRYPKPAAAVQMLADGFDKVGISRDFAIGMDRDFKQLHKLFYRNIAVGVKMGDAAFSLSDEYKFLAEVTKEHNIPFTLE